ncbi:unnamed protein product [Blepharisma stoltei]|uniref:Uncharacterized protein n=1 Tax=Blepharisma stoltei TaxID=1481888 RepID=A0AAU9JAR7_9CILI|nr:unnamed protein product [Blepharisma stoltei]
MNAKEWIYKIKENTENWLETVLVGNKSDLESYREISYEEAKDLADEIGIIYLEISIKENIHANKLIQLTFSLASKIANKLIIP